MLPRFDLAVVINQYNQQYKTDFPDNETFGFDYFAEDLLSAVNASLAYIYYGLDDHYFTKEEMTYQQGDREEYQNAIKRFSQGELTQPPQKPALEDAVHDKIAYYHWVREKQAALNNEENWNSWSEKADDLSALKNAWVRQSVFAHHTHAALLEAIRLLDNLVSHYQDALINMQSYWVKRKKIPQPIYECYQQHCSDFIAAATLTRQQILESMVGRLEAWDRGEESVVVDTVKNVTDKLLASNGDKPLTAPPVTPYRLTPQQLTGFSDYIEQDPDYTRKQRLNRLSWRHSSRTQTDDKAIHLVTLSQEHTSVVVPRTLARDIPKTAGSILLKGRRVRHQFFKNKAYLLASINRPIAIDIVAFDFTHPHCLESTLAMIFAQEGMVGTAIYEAEMALRDLSRLFQGKAIRFLKTWQGLLQDHRLKLLTHKLKLAVRLLDWMQAQTDFYALIQQSQHCRVLQKLLQETQDNIITYGVEASAIGYRQEKTAQDAHRYLISHQTYHYIQKLGEGELLSLSELQAVTAYRAALKSAADKQGFSKICEPHVTTLAARLKNHLQQFDFNQTSQNVMDDILQGDVILHQLGSAGQKRRWQHQQLKFFHRYLAAKQRSLLQPGIIHPAMDKAESLLLHLGRGLPFPDAMTTVAECVKNIRDEKSDAEKRRLISRCQSTAITVTNQLLVGRFNKDMAVFHRNVETVLKSADYGYSDENIERILGFCERAINENKSLDEIVQDKFDRTLVGLNNPKDKLLRVVLEIHIAAERTHRAISKNALLEHNVQCVEKLQHQITAHSDKWLFTDLLKSRSGKRSLFIQSNIDTDLVLQVEKNDSLLSDSIPITLK